MNILLWACDVFIIADGVNFKAAFSLIQDYTELTECFLSLCGYFPLLTLHYINFMLLVEPASTDWVGGFHEREGLRMFLCCYRLKVSCRLNTPVQVQFWFSMGL